VAHGNGIQAKLDIAVVVVVVVSSCRFGFLNFKYDTCCFCL
jgi:hypothetical protein